MSETLVLTDRYFREPELEPKIAFLLLNIFTTKVLPLLTRLQRMRTKI